MKTLKFKHSLASEGHLTPAHPEATPGPQPFGAIVLEVTDLPDNATFFAAQKVLNTITMPSWVYSVSANQAGKNLWRRENLTPEQLTSAPDWWAGCGLDRNTIL